ncbi:MAG: hypothetical protein A2293_04650 [Elusimicrobia bacterium RIFOXYB2_FULL_49_7]|nr:MAG: hypothetical protein A2293_04650 [Elusimicrobia bacterium RIFOXYB2_FULL_49_7]
MQESNFQDNVDALFVPDSIDTTGWCTSKINAGHFDYKQMTDTVRIVLRDSVLGRSYCHPFNGYITSPFGLRKFFWHYGMDVKVKKGDSIRCAFDGIVRVIQNDRYGYGKVVVVRHYGGLETLYGHFSRAKVEVGQRLKAGELVGLGGNTGRSTGSHLHFEIRYCGEPFDPRDIVDFDNFVLKSDTLVLTKANFDYLAQARSTIAHVIRRGDNLGSIARRYGTTVRRLCALNHISGRTLLRVGRKLVIRTDLTAAP